MKRNVELKIIKKMLEFTKPSRYKLAYGGRGGGKSWSVAMLLILKIIQTPNIRILCTREIQNSIGDSVHYLLKSCIGTMGVAEYFEIKESTIRCKNNSEFIFKGLRAGTELSDSLKSMENIAVCWVEEAQSVSQVSLNLLIPTIRSNNSEIWFTMNRKKSIDPVYEYIVGRKDAIVININYKDNPFLPKVLEDEAKALMEHDYKMYQHVWGGEPMDEGTDTILTRTEVLEAMNKEIIKPDSMDDVIGIDVARYGDDDTVFVRRNGNKMVDMKRFHKTDLVFLAGEAMKMKGNNTVYVIDDTGVGGGLTDMLVSANCQVVAINNHNVAQNPALFGSRGCELWFTFKDTINKISIFKDNFLADELTTRRYSYNNKFAKILQPKAKNKLEIGRSPDYADALILCFAGTHTSRNLETLKHSVW